MTSFVLNIITFSIKRILLSAAITQIDILSPHKYDYLFAVRGRLIYAAFVSVLVQWNLRVWLSPSAYRHGFSVMILIVFVATINTEFT